jgi:hypothetical protein
MYYVLCTQVLPRFACLRAQVNHIMTGCIEIAAPRTLPIAPVGLGSVRNIDGLQTIIL